METAKNHCFSPRAAESKLDESERSYKSRPREQSPRNCMRDPVGSLEKARSQQT